MINSDVSFGIINSDAFQINKVELSARIKQANIEDEYNHLIEKFNSSSKYRFAYAKVPLIIRDDECIFDCGSVKSSSLAKVLKGCNEAIFFTVTAGPDSDRLLQRTAIQSKSDAFLLDAIGSALIESFADHINESLIKEVHATKRFSPGYADFPLEFQRILLGRLNAEQTVGISLSDQLLMTPRKSITAVIGIY